MAKKTVPQTATPNATPPPPHLVDLLAFYNMYFAPPKRASLGRLKPHAKGNINLFANLLATGVHYCNLPRVNTPTFPYLKCRSVNPTLLANARIAPRSSHQKCISNATIQLFVNNLLNNGILSKYNTNSGNVTFEDIYDDINNFRMKGTGDLLIYDAALRLAFSIRVEPDQYVYLHSGAMIGANLLKRRGYIQFSIPQGGLSRVPRSTFNGIFPTNMKSLDIEHFLCIFKGFFNTMIVP